MRQDQYELTPKGVTPNPHLVDASAQVVQIYSCVHIGCQTRVCMPQDALRDDEGNASPREKSGSGPSKVVESKRLGNGLRPKLHLAFFATSYRVVLVALYFLAPLSAADVLVSEHYASASERPAQNKLKLRPFAPH